MDVGFRVRKLQIRTINIFGSDFKQQIPIFGPISYLKFKI